MVSSLFEMCRRCVASNIDQLTDVGEMPYEMLRPALKKIQTPGQLYEIEKLSPHIALEDAELWHAFIKRDVPDGEKKIPLNSPSDPSKWYKVYRKLVIEDQRQQEAAESILKAALNKKQVEKDANKTNILANTFIPDKAGKRPGAFGAPRAAPSGSIALRNAKTNADKLAILKRQTAHRQQGRAATQSIPTHALQQSRSAVLQAPRGMVNQYTRPIVNTQQPLIAKQPASRPVVFSARAGPQSETERAINNALRLEREEKERKLRALTGATKVVPSKHPGLHEVVESHASPPTKAAPPRIRKRIISPPRKIAQAPVNPVTGPPNAPSTQSSGTTTNSLKRPAEEPASPVACPSQSAAPQQTARSAQPSASTMPRKKRPYSAFLPYKKRTT